MLTVQAAFGAVMTALLIVGIVAYRSVLASSESAQWAQHTNEVLEHLANLRLGMENIENGYRDFALSGADAFLQWSRANTSLVDTEQRALRALTADNPRQQRRLSVMTDLLQRMSNVATQSLDCRRHRLPKMRRPSFEAAGPILQVNTVRLRPRPTPIGS